MWLSLKQILWSTWMSPMPSHPLRGPSPAACFRPVQYWTFALTLPFNVDTGSTSPGTDGSHIATPSSIWSHCVPVLRKQRGATQVEEATWVARGWADMIQLIVIKWHDRGEWLSATWQVGSLYLLAQGSVHSSVLTDSYSVPPLHSPCHTLTHTHTHPGEEKQTFAPSPNQGAFPIKLWKQSKLPCIKLQCYSIMGKGTIPLIWLEQGNPLFPKAIMRFHVPYCDCLRVHTTEFLPLHMVFLVSMETRLI